MRKLLGEGRLVTRTPGYLLRVEPGELDLDRFERLYQRGHEAMSRGAATEAAYALRSALALWRGPALANVLYEPFGLSEADRLEERRLLALEERIDADLELGRSDELIPELEALVRDHPLRERLLGQRMLALYRSGRQAEALAALQAARHRLAEELGLEPGPYLQGLERRILQHDPALAVPREGSSRDRPRGRPVAVAVARPGDRCSSCDRSRARNRPDDGVANRAAERQHARLRGRPFWAGSDAEWRSVAERQR